MLCSSTEVIVSGTGLVRRNSALRQAAPGRPPALSIGERYAANFSVRPQAPIRSRPSRFGFRASLSSSDALGSHDGKCEARKASAVTGGRSQCHGRYPADPPTVKEIVAVMRAVGDDPEGLRLRGLIGIASGIDG